MKIASWNIMHGEIVTPGQGEDALTLFKESVLAIDAQVIGLQEVDHLHPRSGSINQAKEIADSMQAQDWAFAPCFYVIEDQQINIDPKETPIITNANESTTAAYGIALISKEPVLEWRRHNLPLAKLGKFMTISTNGKLVRIYATDHSRCALAAVLGNVILINVHLSFIWPFNWRQFQDLKKWASELEAEFKLPVFIMGDLNLRRLGWGNRWHSLMKAITFPVWKPQRQIDYFLNRNQHELHSEIYTSAISDHFAISIDIEIE